VPSTPRRNLLISYLGLLVAGGLAAERLAMLARLPATDFDDAYMYMRYAEHLLAGQGLVWNPGEGRVFGVTSLLHLGVVTVLRLLLPGRPLPSVLGAASGGAAIGLIVALVALLSTESRHVRLRGNWIFWTVALLPLVTLGEAFRFHAGTGMDTMLAALANAFVVLATLRLARSPSGATLLWAVAAAVLAVLARPDNLPCAVLGPALGLLLLAPRPRGKWLGLFCASMAGALAAVALLAWLAFGSPLPLSFFAKQPYFYGDFAGEFAWNPYLFLMVFGRSAWPFILALIFFADSRGFRRAVVLLAPASVAIAALGHFNQIMGHLGRFYYPFLPYFVVAGALAVDDWLQRGAPLRSRATLLRAGCAFSVILIGHSLLSLEAELYEARGADQRLERPGGYHVPASETLPDLDSWQAAYAIAAIAATAPEGTRFAMSEHGLPGAVAPDARIIDVLGLHDPYFAHHRFSAAELFRRKPDLIWLPHDDHAQMLRDIVGSEELWAHYAFYPDAFFHGIALREDGPHRAALTELVARQWRRCYPGMDMADYRARRGQ
jgi:hypothetical protein